MERLITSELANILSPYESRGWRFELDKSTTPGYKGMLVLIYTIPNQPPRIERFHNDGDFARNISKFLAGVQVLAHGSRRHHTMA